MSKTDFLPRQYGNLLAWMNNFDSYLDNGDTVARLALDGDKIAVLRKAVGLYRTAFMRAEGTNAGAADRLVRMEMAEAATQAVRYFVNSELRYNDRMSDTDRAHFGLKVPDRTLTLASEPSEYPAIEVRIFVLRELALRFINSATHRTGKPAQALGLDVRWAIVPHGKPATLAMLVNATFVTRPALTLSFTDEERGEAVGICARYAGRRGLFGPFGAIITAIIP
jgi:hypothetical protein